jgi:hypothetical protein
MFMDFERRNENEKPSSFHALLAEKQQTAKILSFSQRPFQFLQTLFLEDLLSP